MQFDLERIDYMGFFSDIFKHEETNNKEMMLSYISEYMGYYASNHQSEADEVAYIFANAIQMINASSEKTLTKSTHSNNATPESAALNILQNCAMSEIKPISGVSFLLEDSNGPFDLYNSINEEKLNRGYISKSQYEENKKLGNRRHLASPLGF